jgi:hypothetical protein
MSPWGDTLPEQLRDDISIDQQHPSARFLTASLLMAQDGSGSQGDRGADARLRPGVAGSRGGRPRPPRLRGEGAEGAVFVRPMRPPTRARSSRDGELKFRQQAWPVARCRVPDGQATSLRGAETFVVPPRCRKA